jgi:ubiquinone/menaquinone biosynthesis C-methylase UbiE
MRLVNSRPNILAIAALDLQPSDEVLELGCGSGHAAIMMAAKVRCGTVHAIDPSAAMLAQARARNRQVLREGRVRLYQARAEQLPFSNHSMDKILAVNVAYFWHDPVAVLKEIGRVLRPNGILLVYVTDAAVMRRWPFASAETHRLFDRDDLARALQEASFCDVAIRTVRITRRIVGLIATIKAGSAHESAKVRIPPF